MDDTKRQAAENREHQLRIRLKLPDVTRWWTGWWCSPVGRKARRVFGDLRVRTSLALMAALVVIAELITIVQPYFVQHTYAIDDRAASLLPIASPLLAAKLVHDPKNAVYNFNAGFSPSATGPGQSGGGGPQITAAASDDPSKGLTVTDPAGGVDLTFKPTFKVLKGQKQDNRVVYPLADGAGWLVYTMQAAEVKEDVVLQRAGSNTASFGYDLEMGNSLQARLLGDGLIGVYGANLPINGNVSTGTPKDAELLQKMREKAPKNTLLFTIPAPLVKEYNQTRSGVSAHYELHGNHLKVVVSGLKRAHYPLTIDPSVYVQGAVKFMRGNNESDIDFDTTNNLIRKGALTGARFPNYTVASNSLNVARWGAATVVAGGYIYEIGGSSGSTNTGTVYWAKLNTSTYTIDSPDPGNGSCTNWCTSSAYNLPSSQVRLGLAAVAYNGYLYAIGGKDAGCTGTNHMCSTVYVTKVGANGEPIGWSATSSIVTARGYFGAAVYNNHIYIVGGQTNSSLNGETTVEYAAPNPDGTIPASGAGAWTTTGMTALGTGVWGNNLLQYNGYLYDVGGANTTTPVASNVSYIKINSDGTLASSWLTTSSFASSRASFGGTYATLWGGYMYVNGGCITVTSTDCSSFTTYSTGTASQSGTTVTGSGTTWTPAMVGSVLTFNNGTAAMITAYTSATSLTVDISQTVTSQAYTIDTGQTATQIASFNADGTITDWTQVPTDDIFYSTGTASQSNTTTVTGSGTSWTSAMVGMILTYPDGNTAKITLVGSTTSMTVSIAYTETGSTYAISSPFGRIFSQGLVAWRGTVYSIGGCAKATVSGNCTATGGPQTANNYGVINGDGDVSPPDELTALPPVGTDAGDGSFDSSGVVVNNGFIYNVGGCTVSSTCNLMTPNTSYAPINADGTIGSWTVDSTHLVGIYANGGTVTQSGTTVTGSGTNFISAMVGMQISINGATKERITAVGSTTSITVSVSQTVSTGQSYTVYSGLGAFGITVYDNTIYIAGGTDGTCGTGTPCNASLSNIGWRSEANRVSLNSDGSLNSWTRTLSVQPSVYGYSAMFARAVSATTGNLYIVGGCQNTSTGVGCSNNIQNTVLKCTITNSSGALSSCATTGQTQIPDLDASTGGSQGLGIMGYTMYGDYIYLAGGSCGTSTTSGTTADQRGCDGSSTTTVNTSETNKVLFAKIDSSGNVGSWTISDINHQLPRVRRRNVAYAVNGYLYVTAGHDGSGGGNGTTLNDIVAAKIDQTTGNLATSFTTLETTITPRWNLGAATANGYIYLVGGCTAGTGPPNGCSSTSSVAESVQIFNNYSGSPKSYSSQNNIGVDRIGGSATVLNGYIYYAGGCTDMACTTPSANVYYAPINSDGTIGTFTAAGNSLPATRAWGKLLNAGGTLYYVGGQDSSCTTGNGTGVTGVCSTVYYSTPSSGVPGTWSSTVALPGERTQMGAAVFNNRIYVAGGANGAGTVQSTVYYSPSLSAGGAISGSWTSTTAFTTAREGAVLVAYGAALYLMGGFDGTNYLLDVQYAPITTGTGAVGTWNNSTTLPQPIRDADGFAANGYLYVVGGRSASTTCTTNTYIAPIIGYPPGSSNRYGIGLWSQTSVAYTGARYGLATAYYNGKVYLQGGGCSAFVSSTDRAYASTLQAQPQVSTYSLMIDTDTNVFPSKWLMNGVDNGVGAQWVFSYRSSTNANNTWGVITNAGSVTLGTPGTYTPLDASGNNTNTTAPAVGARYYFLYVTVDASQSFGFAEDVSRGPTITDLTLEFTSDPGKRLMHGRTFIGGQQQPEDTPF
ncbi:MAG TPA: hypothetical protein VKQ34_00340 [Candidatus Saccharimonadales bacterium]|nr:hypothetical protein [Candidatus Saccharimonadales bacterium]